MAAPIAHLIRLARPADLRHLAAIEDAGARLFEEHLGERMVSALRAPSPSGGDRLDAAGVLLVAAPGQGAPVGFAQVLFLEGWAHLDQVSVLPEHGRVGLGTALVRAAMAEARWAGFDRLSLITFLDVPWNGPFYRGLGFTEVQRLEPFQQRLRDHEVAIGLDQAGPRGVLAVSLRE